MSVKPRPADAPNVPDKCMTPGVGPPSQLSPQTWQVPSFTASLFREKRSRYCVAVFVINEGKRIQAQLQRMRELADAIDVVIADGGSTDGSLGEETLRSHGVRGLLVKTGPGRLSAQMRMAFAFALREGYEGIVVMDGNNKDDPAAIPAFLEQLDNGCDHVQGSRFIRGGRAINTPWIRLAAVRLLHAPLISWAAGCKYTDTTNGFRAYSRRLLLDPRVAPFRDLFSDYELHYYLAIRSARLGFRTTEVPVSRTYPSSGSTPTKITPWKGNLLILRTLCRASLNRFDPPRTGTDRHRGKPDAS